MDSRERLVALLLVVYLLAVAVGALLNLVGSFDEQKVAANTETATASALTSTPRACASWLPVCEISGDRKLLAQALLAGMVGSFLHSAQSLTSYIGNDTFKMSWTAWYILRPWIGGVLGLALAFTARAGLVGVAATGSDAVNVNGLVTIGLLGGWFSKTTTDKLQEVFSTLFKTDADKERTDKLKEAQPTVKTVDPSPVPVDATQLTVTGTQFLTGATVTINKVAVDVTSVTPAEVKVDLSKLVPRPVGDAQLIVKNPSGTKPESEPVTVTFDGPAGGTP